MLNHDHFFEKIDEIKNNKPILQFRPISIGIHPICPISHLSDKRGLRKEKEKLNFSRSPLAVSAAARWWEHRLSLSSLDFPLSLSLTGFSLTAAHVQSRRCPWPSTTPTIICSAPPPTLEITGISIFGWVPLSSSRSYESNLECV